MRVFLAAARAAGVRRFVAQSYTGWLNERTGGPVESETDPPDPSPPNNQRQTLAAIEYLEGAVLDAPLESVALRFGMFYGPGASDDAAAASVAALTQGSGIYNMVDDEPAPVREIFTALANGKAKRELQWTPRWASWRDGFRFGLGSDTRAITE